MRKGSVAHSPLMSEVQEKKIVREVCVFFVSRQSKIVFLVVLISVCVFVYVGTLLSAHLWTNVASQFSIYLGAISRKLDEKKEDCSYSNTWM